MTLPVLIEKALRRRFGDDTLRYTYPLGSWKFEHSSDPATSIVTLGTLDGFSVCFSIPRQKQSELSEAFARQPAPKVTQLIN